VNFYMFCGGTNFAFLNGANSEGPNDFQPVVTSYDYDGPLTEAGDPTDKYVAIRNVIGKYTQLPPGPAPQPSPKKSYGTVSLDQKASVFDLVAKLTPVTNTSTLTFEELGLAYGFVLYRTTLQTVRQGTLTINGLHDRAYVFGYQQLIGVLQRPFNNSISINLPQGSSLDILVENQGRVNYGPYINDPKGILEGVTINNQPIQNWYMYPLPLTDLSSLAFSPRGGTQAPGSFYSGSFTVDPAMILDSFLDTRGWGKGNVWINGFNLGRYFNVGPQFSLYVPYPILKPGQNTMIVLELIGIAPSNITFSTSPLWQ